MSKEECQLCEISEKFSQEHKQATGYQPSGRFNPSCLGCCVRLVRSARPSWDMQDRMLAYIATHQDAPTRAEIIAAMKQKKGQ